MSRVFHIQNNILYKYDPDIINKTLLSCLFICQLPLMYLLFPRDIKLGILHNFLLSVEVSGVYFVLGQSC